MAVNFGVCQEMSLVTGDLCKKNLLLGGRASGESGVFHQTPCYIIPLLCKCLHVFDEICRRSANCMRSCMVHTNVVRSLANYCILFGRCESPIRRNVLYFCTVCVDLMLFCLTSCRRSLTLLFESTLLRKDISHEQSVC